MDKLTRAQLLILHDFGTHSLTDQQRFHLFEIVEERYRRKSTLITAQAPVGKWHDLSRGQFGGVGSRVPCSVHG
nr:ATP-binding protein [Mesorhizobium sp.]